MGYDKKPNIFDNAWDWLAFPCQRTLCGNKGVSRLSDLLQGKIIHLKIVFNYLIWCKFTHLEKLYHSGLAILEILKHTMNKRIVKNSKSKQSLQISRQSFISIHRHFVMLDA